MNENHQKPERVFALIAGPSGSGKSYGIATFPKSLIIDSDIGGGLRYADSMIRANGSRRIGPGGLNAGTEDDVTVADYPELLDLLNRLDRQGALKNISTLCIDHLTVFQDNAVSRINPGLQRDYGRANDVATRQWKQVREICRNKDFNLVCIAHLKGKWEHEEQVGMQAAGPKEIAGDMDIELHLRRDPSGKYPSRASVLKWRRLPNDPRGAVPPMFPFTFEAFSKIEGTGAFDRARVPLVMASVEQVALVRKLLAESGMKAGTEARWLQAANAERFEDMPSDSVQKCIVHLHKIIATKSPV